MTGSNGEIHAVREARGEKYGPPSRQFKVAQQLKAILRDACEKTEGLGTHPPISRIHAECLEMIATKLSRIVCGKSDYDDNWLDIKGYADIGVEYSDRGAITTYGLGTLGDATDA